MRVAAGATAPRRKPSQRCDERVAVSAAVTAGRGDSAPTTVTVHVPLAFHQRRGRKVLVAPDEAGSVLLGASPSPTHSPHDVTPAVRVIARGFRWRKLLETGVFATIHELAAAENINPSYVSRVLRLTLLSPDNVASVLNPRIKPGAADFLASIPISWSEQDPT